MTPVRFSQPSRRSALISLTPLIDVVFMLLLFFMLATSFQQWRSMDLAPARPSASAATTRVEPIVLMVFPQRLELEGATITAAALAAQVKQRKTDSTTPPVLVTAHESVRLQRLVQALDELRDQGVPNPMLVVSD